MALNRTGVILDDGCEWSPSCLTCPLPQCKYDAPGAVQREEREFRDGRILEAQRSGLTVAEIAKQFNVGKRTVFRVVQKGS